MSKKLKVVVLIKYTTEIEVPDQECALGNESAYAYARKRGREEYEDDNRTTYSDTVPVITNVVVLG